MKKIYLICLVILIQCADPIEVYRQCAEFCGREATVFAYDSRKDKAECECEDGSAAKLKINWK